MKFKFLLTPLLSSVLFLSACSATFEADLKNLIKETDGKDLDVSKLIITSEGKQILIGYLKKSYEVNSEKTTELLLNAWKQSAEKNEIGIDLFNWTKSIFSGVNTFNKKQKVEYFNMTYKGIAMFQLKPSWTILSHEMKIILTEDSISTKVTNIISTVSLLLKRIHIYHLRQKILMSIPKELGYLFRFIEY